MNTTIIYPDMFDSDKTVKEQYWNNILYGGYKTYKYCRKHPNNMFPVRKNYICRNNSKL